MASSTSISAQALWFMVCHPIQLSGVQLGWSQHLHNDPAAAEVMLLQEYDKASVQSRVVLDTSSSFLRPRYDPPEMSNSPALDLEPAPGSWIQPLNHTLVPGAHQYTDQCTQAYPNMHVHDGTLTCSVMGSWSEGIARCLTCAGAIRGPSQVGGARQGCVVQAARPASCRYDAR